MHQIAIQAFEVRPIIEKAFDGGVVGKKRHRLEIAGRVPISARFREGQAKVFALGIEAAQARTMLRV